MSQEFMGPEMVPHSREAEEATLGGVMLNPSVYPLINLEPGDFYIHRNGWVWEVFQKLDRDGIVIDLLTVTEALDGMGYLSQMGGASYLTKLVNNVPSSLHVEDYARTVRKTANRRRGLDIHQKGVQLAYDESEDYDPSVIAEELLEISSSDTRIEPIEMALTEVVDDLVHGTREPGLMTGLKALDATINMGFRFGDLVFVAGPPGMGKTVLTTQMAIEEFHKHGPGAILSSEMAQDSMMLRVISLVSGMTEDRLERGAFNEQEILTIGSAKKDLANLPIYFSDHEAWTTSQLRSELARLKYQHGIRWFLFDYLQLLEDKVAGEPWQQTEATAKRLRKLCRSLEITGIVVASVTKAGFDAKKPKMSDLKGGGQALHEGDAVYWLHQWIPNEDSEEDMDVEYENIPFLRRLYELKKRKGRKHLSPLSLRFDRDVPKLHEVTMVQPDEQEYYWQKD